MEEQSVCNLYIFLCVCVCAIGTFVRWCHYRLCGHKDDTLINHLYPPTPACLPGQTGWPITDTRGSVMSWSRWGNGLGGGLMSSASISLYFLTFPSFAARIRLANGHLGWNKELKIQRDELNLHQNPPELSTSINLYPLKWVLLLLCAVEWLLGFDSWRWALLHVFPLSLVCSHFLWDLI